jgi:hypothetical protein
MSYLKNSNIKLSIDLNPLTWSFQWIWGGPGFKKFFYIRILPFVFMVIIDDGVVETLNELNKDFLEKDLYDE